METYVSNKLPTVETIFDWGKNKDWQAKNEYEEP